MWPAPRPVISSVGATGLAVAPVDPRGLTLPGCNCCGSQQPVHRHAHPQTALRPSAEGAGLGGEQGPAGRANQIGVRVQRAASNSGPPGRARPTTGLPPRPEPELDELRARRQTADPFLVSLVIQTERNVGSEEPGLPFLPVLSANCSPLFPVPAWTQTRSILCPRGTGRAVTRTSVDWPDYASGQCLCRCRRGGLEQLLPSPEGFIVGPEDGYQLPDQHDNPRLPATVGRLPVRPSSRPGHTVFLVDQAPTNLTHSK